MNLRPKTFRRLIVLAVGILVVVGSIGGFYIVKKQQLAARITQSRVDGMAAIERGDKQTALTKLSYYLGKVKNDPEAMIAFADVRRTVPMDKGNQLREAKDWYSAALQQDRDNMHAKRALLEIYPRIGFSSEARALADEVLKQNPKDMEALQAKMLALIMLEQFEGALEVGQKMAEIDPSNYMAQLTIVDMMFQTRKPLADIQAHADALLAKYPNDARFEMVQAAVALRNDRKRAVDWLTKAASRSAPDGTFARDLARLMERAQMFAQARDYLERYSQKVDDPQVLIVLAQRLWQDEKYDAVLERLKDVSPTDVSADADLLALKALSSQARAAQLAATQPAEQRAAATQPATELTREIVTAMESRRNDAAARTWSGALKTLILNPTPSPRDRAVALRRSISEGRENGIVRFILARTALELGETETALNDLKIAAAVMNSWEAPHLLRSRALLSSGRYAAATDAAAAAIQRDPQNLEGRILNSLAWHAYLGERPDAKDSERLLDQVTGLQQLFRPNGEPQTLPIYVSLLSRLGNRDAATKAVNAALASPKPYPLDSLLKLAGASRQQKLGLEEQILALASKAYGQVPQVALARAMVLADAGKPADGMAFLEDAIAASGQAETLPWQFILAQYRESIRDPQAGMNWAKLGDANPENLTVQNATLNAPSRYNQRDAWSKAIERMKVLTGDSATGWRIERARYILSGVVDPNSKELADTMSDMAALIRQNPDMIEPRLLLASAQVQTKNVASAVKQLEAAAQSRPDDVSIGLQLYRLLREEGRLDESRSYLERLSAGKTFNGESRVQVAAALADVGQSQRAIDLLNNAPADESAAGPRDLLLARLYRRLGNVNAATVVYNRWLASPSPDAGILSSAADFFSSMDRDDDARNFLDRLKDAPLQAGQRELLLAAYEEAHGDTTRAAELFTEATKVAPTDASTWRQLAAFEIRGRRYDRALAAVTEGLKLIPGDTDLQTMNQQVQALNTDSAATTDLQPLIDLMSRDPRNVAGAATLKLLVNANTSKQSDDQTLTQLRELGDRYPQFLPLQGILARAYLAADRYTDAAAIATRAEQMFPADAQAARLATQVYARSNRPDLMLAAAGRWRRLANENPTEADASLARAQMLTGDLGAARATLSPYLAQARLEPDRYPELLSASAQLLILSGKSGEAVAVLTPLAKGSASWRTTWRSLASAHTTGDGAVSWASQIPLPAQLDTNEQYAQAAMWFEVGERYGRPDALERARVVAKELTASPSATVRQWRLSAYVERALGDMAASLAAFRRVLELEPNQPDTQNNIAYMIMLQGGDLSEARKLAESAVATAPRSASYLDTLARIQVKQGDMDAALGSFNSALELDPRSLEALVGKASVFLSQNKKDDAKTLMPQIEQGARTVGASIDPDLRKQLEAVRQATAQ